MNAKITQFYKSNKPAAEANKTFCDLDLILVHFRHLNNQKRSSSMDMYNKECESLDLFIAMGNEPNAPFNNIYGLNRRNHLIYKQQAPCKENDINKWPRSYIYASKKLDIWPVSTLTTRDVTTAILDTHDEL